MSFQGLIAFHSFSTDSFAVPVGTIVGFRDRPLGLSCPVWDRVPNRIWRMSPSLLVPIARIARVSKAMAKELDDHWVAFRAYLADVYHLFPVKLNHS